MEPGKDLTEREKSQIIKEIVKGKSADEAAKKLGRYVSTIRRSLQSMRT